MSIFKLENVIQNYAWGSKVALNKTFHIANPEHQPQAEMWMGAHLLGDSYIPDKKRTLSELIMAEPTNLLGYYTTNRFGELPYLLKVLAANSPLSIQVHPSKSKAELGFKRENRLKIAMNAPNRNYKDANHKPELIYALSFFLALNGFRAITEIIALFKMLDIQVLKPQLQQFSKQPNSLGLKTFFTHIIKLSGNKKHQALNELYTLVNEPPAKGQLSRKVLGTIKELMQHYQDDVGLFAPLLFNIIELKPGEAMFLHAETPHAYLSGTAIEIMANSDNVLRAGLTQKHIDVDELVDNLLFEPILSDELLLQPIKKPLRATYPVPVDDFCFDIQHSTEVAQTFYTRSAEILFCLEGEVSISTTEQNLCLTTGQSVFIGCNTTEYQLIGKAKLARAYN